MPSIRPIFAKRNGFMLFFFLCYNIHVLSIFLLLWRKIRIIGENTNKSREAKK